MTRWGTLVIGYSLGTGYWSFNGHWVFGPWPFFRYSSLIHNSDFGIRHLLFSLLPTSLLPICLFQYFRRYIAGVYRWYSAQGLAD